MHAPMQSESNRISILCMQCGRNNVDFADFDFGFRSLKNVAALSIETEAVFKICIEMLKKVHCKITFFYVFEALSFCFVPFSHRDNQRKARSVYIKLCQRLSVMCFLISFLLHARYCVYFSHTDRVRGS